MNYLSSLKGTEPREQFLLRHKLRKDRNLCSGAWNKHLRKLKQHRFHKNQFLEVAVLSELYRICIFVYEYDQTPVRTFRPPDPAVKSAYLFLLSHQHYLALVPPNTFTAMPPEYKPRAVQQDISEE